MSLGQRKVVVRLKGGMGNQLFQYAFALFLANGEPRNVTCLLDYFPHDSRHGGFALAGLLGPEVQVSDALPPGVPWLYVNADALADADLSHLLSAHSDLFIDGYFQNVANFAPVIDRLRAMFLSQFDQENYFRRLRALTANLPCERVLAIHLRRGDFLNPEVRAAHGIPDPASILQCLSRVTTPGYCAVVFSDSDAAMDLPCPAVRLTGPEPRSLMGDIDQFRLMSCCDWIVASNSTFSYWAGMLSHRVQQTFVPSPWMRSGSVRTESLLTARVESYGTQLL